MTLLPNFLVNFLGIFLIGSIQRVLVSLLTKLLTDNIFVNGPVFKCPFTKTVSDNNFINKLANTLKIDPIRKIPRKFTKKFGNKVINRQYFRRNTGLKMFQNMNQRPAKFYLKILRVTKKFGYLKFNSKGHDGKNV